MGILRFFDLKRQWGPTRCAVLALVYLFLLQIALNGGDIVAGLNSVWWFGILALAVLCLEVKNARTRANRAAEKSGPPGD
ncbi:hypothetical protein QP948_05650 [Corynebacterium bovis]|uniref:hypothetical protein n=1 Tax=Corynebacterium bovis TaxID=36808 RepID=UPI00254EB3C7|nr:hypothetical protein [Corynebacterium bovis]MDK8510890.1 hypothetical protein [Corynebacterium bovis]